MPTVHSSHVVSGLRLCIEQVIMTAHFPAMKLSMLHQTATAWMVWWIHIFWLVCDSISTSCKETEWYQGDNWRQLVKPSEWGNCHSVTQAVCDRSLSWCKASRDYMTGTGYLHTVKCSYDRPHSVSAWVSSFLTAHQNIRGHSVPYKFCVKATM